MRQKSLSALLLASLFAIPFLTGTARAQSQNQAAFYMKVSASNGVIAGESTDAAHPGWILLRSVHSESSAGGEQTALAKAPRDVATGQASGKRQHETIKVSNPQNGAAVGGNRGSKIVVTKITDKSSPLLAEAAASGEHLPQVVIEAYNGGVRKEHLVLKDVMVSSYKTTRSAADVVPTETITFQAAQIKRQ